MIIQSDNSDNPQTARVFAPSAKEVNGLCLKFFLVERYIWLGREMKEVVASQAVWNVDLLLFLVGVASREAMKSSIWLIFLTWYCKQSANK